MGPVLHHVLLATASPRPLPLKALDETSRPEALPRGQLLESEDMLFQPYRKSQSAAQHAAQHWPLECWECSEAGGLGWSQLVLCLCSNTKVRVLCMVLMYKLIISIVRIIL